MSCSQRKISYLLEAYMEMKQIRFYGRGGFTLKQPGIAGGEPDESYCIGSDKIVPDLVIDIVVTSGTLNKLPLYQAKNILEVWIWQNDELYIHVLNTNGYQIQSRSRLFPDLDIPLLVKHIEMLDQYDAVRAFRQAISAT